MEHCGRQNNAPKMNNTFSPPESVTMLGYMTKGN